MSQKEQYELEELCLEITNKCLLNCMHCSSDSHVEGEQLDKETILRVIDDFESLKGKELEISGGEPLLHPDIWEILKYCENKHFLTALYTTGVANLSNSDIVSRLNVDKVSISLNGTRKATGEITGRDSYRKTTDFMDRLVKSGIETEIHFVPMRQNYRDFDDLLKECEEIGVRKVKVLRLMPQGRALENWEKIHLPELEFKKLIEHYHRIDSSIEIDIGTPASVFFRLDTKCKAGTSTCLIRHDGNVYPCPALKTKSTLCAGNVKEKSLKEIWGDGFYTMRSFKEVAHPYCLAPWIAPKSSGLEEYTREIRG